MSKLQVSEMSKLQVSEICDAVLQIARTEYPHWDNNSHNAYAVGMMASWLYDLLNAPDVTFLLNHRISINKRLKEALLRMSDAAIDKDIG